MRPTKIYIGAKQAAELEKNSEGRHTMTVKTFPSKNDVEYTDLSQVWHNTEDRLPMEDEPVCFVYKNAPDYIVSGSLVRWTDYSDTDCTAFLEHWEDIADQSYANVGDVHAWAYMSDLEPKLGWGNE